MSGISVVLVTVEIVIAIAVVWAMLHEDFFIKLENRLFERFMSAVKSHRGVKKNEPSEVRCDFSENEDLTRIPTFVA